MEMTIYGDYDKFRGLYKQDGKWVEIFRATNTRFNLTATLYTQVHIIDRLNNRIFVDFKNIHAIPYMDHMDQNYPIVIFNTEAHFDDPKNLRMVFYIRDNIDSRIKCVASGDNAYAFWDALENMRGRGHVIVVLKMWRV
ncbi:unnamed protein product [Eruca vesicaria subsp. sativa]|uniref:Uncharacterized protein n=1 Tax=Eruca vesicaria subsp. sativa TaxID=29727 RepID=A0ABC8KDT6_ERUVS|nr:unnamed protein product [Eruca vesicaria subsp. sativa]